MQLQISEMLRKKLMQVREIQLQHFREKISEIPKDRQEFLRYYYEELASVDGVHLYGTIGADAYLTYDGRILVAIDHTDPAKSHPPCETSNVNWIALGLSTFALAFNLSEVLEFLPTRPIDEPPCSQCKGMRFEGDSAESRWVCSRCCGLGWGQPNFNDQ